jgi:NAD(P) transhydrogenase subunit alpha
LITEEMVKSMKPGSVIVDMAVEKGGNCPLSELGKTVVKQGVILVGQPNIAALVPTDASALYARNLLDFMKLIVTKEGSLHIPADDDIVTATLVTRDGAVLRS